MSGKFLFIRRRNQERLGFIVFLDRSEFMTSEIPRRGGKRVRVTWRLLDELPWFKAKDGIVRVYRENELRGKLKTFGDSVW